MGSAGANTWDIDRPELCCAKGGTRASCLTLVRRIFPGLLGKPGVWIAWIFVSARAIYTLPQTSLIHLAPHGVIPFAKSRRERK